MNNVRASLVALSLVAASGAVIAQDMGSAFPIANSVDLGTQYGDQSNDPRQVEMLFKEGNAIVDILKGLKDKGFKLDYKEKQIPRSMTLLSLPKSTQIDEVLREILEPWDLALYHNPYGRWVVRPEKNKHPKAQSGDAVAKMDGSDKSQSSGDAQSTATAGAKNP